MAVSYRKNAEQGMWFEIQCVEEIIALKEKDNEDCAFEKKLLRSWKRTAKLLGTGNRKGVE